MILFLLNTYSDISYLYKNLKIANTKFFHIYIWLNLI